MTAALLSLAIADPADGWSRAGFHVEDPAGRPTIHVGGVQLELLGPEAGKRIVGWTIGGLATPVGSEGIDGLPTATAPAPTATDPATPSVPPAPPVAHPNGVTAIDHVVVLSPDLDRTTAAFEHLGIPARRTREVDPSQYGFPARQVFFKLGPVIVEVVGASHAAPDAAERPASFFGLAFTTEDLDGLSGLLGEAVGTAKAAVQPGRRIATLRHKAVGTSVATAFMSPEPAR